MLGELKKEAAGRKDRDVGRVLSRLTRTLLGAPGLTTRSKDATNFGHLIKLNSSYY